MVTNENQFEGVNATQFSLYGLSTDAKPTNTFDGRKIANGSSFFEMDTQDVKFYNADSNTWV